MNNSAPNLLYSYLFQCHLRFLYEQYAYTAEQEGFPNIASFFKEMAEVKKEHIRWIYILILKSKKVKETRYFSNITFDLEHCYPIGTTSENLYTAFNAEKTILNELNAKLLEMKQKENLVREIIPLNTILKSEKKTLETLKILVNIFDNKPLRKKQEISFWECQGCGFKISIYELPEDWICPSCGQLASYFQKKYFNLIYEEHVIWKCMECGDEVSLQTLPDSWRCLSCGKKKPYFKRKATTLTDLQTTSYSFKSREKAIWKCPSCGAKTEINLPLDWSCPDCGFEMK